jgi:phage-related protein
MYPKILDTNFIFDLGDSYFVDAVKHDRAMTKDMEILEVTREDGGVVVSAKFNVKEIVIEGKIICDTIAELEQKIDNLLQKVNVLDGKLVVPYAGGYRLFNVNYKNHSIGKDDEYVTDCTYAVYFIVCNPPFGLDCDQFGELTQTNAYTKNGFSEDMILDSVTISGTVEAQPIIKIKFVGAGDVDSIELINSTTGQMIEVDDSSITDGDTIVIDVENLSVLKNGDEIDYDGVFPEFAPGVNDFIVNFYSSTGTAIGQQQIDNNSKKVFYGDITLAQQITTDSDTNVLPKIALLLQKVGNPYVANFQIQTDVADSPSGVAVTNGSITINYTDVHDVASWIYKNFANNLFPVLAPNTKYWLVLNSPLSDEQNYYNWYYGAGNIYAAGKAKRKFGANAWVEIDSTDFCFKTFKTKLDQQNVNSNQVVSVEDFSTTTKKDTENTTAKWTGDGSATNTSIDNIVNSNSSNTSEGRQTFIAANGTLVQLFYDGTNLCAVKSLDNGATWIKLDGTAGITAVVNSLSGAGAVIDASDNIHICYDAGDRYSETGVVKYLKLSYAGGSWSVGTAVSVTPTGEYYQSTIAVDSTGKVWVIGWNGNSHYAGSFSYYSTNGTDWTSAGSVETMTNTYGFPYKLRLLNDVPFMFTSGAGWDQMEGQYTNIWVACRKWVAGAWTTGGSFTSNGQAANTTFNVEAFGNNLYILYFRGSDGALCVVPHNGTAFGAETYLMSGSYITDPAFSKDASNLYGFVKKGSASFTYGSTVTYNLYCTIFNGTTWSNPADKIITVESSGTKAFVYSVAQRVTATNLFISHTQRGAGAPYLIKLLRLNFLSVVQSINISTYNLILLSAVISEVATKPAGTSITHKLTANGVDFEDFVIGVKKTFAKFGKDLRFKSTLVGNIVLNPVLDSISISTETAAILLANNDRVAQSFLSGFTGTCNRTDLQIKKFGTPGNLWVKVYTDAGGDKPSAELKSKEITAANITDVDFAWLAANFATTFNLTTGNKYWIEISASGCDASNGYLWLTSQNNVYANGKCRISSDAGSNYADADTADALFKVYQSGGAASIINFIINYVKKFI